MDNYEWLERLRAEHRKLRQELNRIENLIDRLNSGETRIDDQPEHYALLVEQRAAMRIYLSALDSRIEVLETRVAAEIAAEIANLR